MAREMSLQMSSSDCIFCRVAAKQIPSQIVFEDEKVVAFRDLNPQAPTHILLIPRKHMASMADVQDADQTLLGDLMMAAKNIAKSEGLPKNGYRVVVNTGANAGQTVFHLHLHLMGGRSFSWPPG